MWHRSEYLFSTGQLLPPGWRFQNLPKISPLCPHPFPPCHTASAPAAGWSRKRLGPGGRKAFRNCRNVRRGAGGGKAPALLRWQLACLLEGRRLTSHRRNPCPLCRPAPAGCQGRVGNGPVAGRLPDAGLAQTRRRPRIANGRPSPCRRAPPALMPRPVSGPQVRGTQLPVGCGHHPAILGPARGLRHPVHAPRMHSHTNHLPEASARARPSGPGLFSPNPGGIPRGNALACPRQMRQDGNRCAPKCPHRSPRLLFSVQNQA